MKISTQWVGNQLYEARMARGWSQQILANHLGASVRSVASWERNEAVPMDVWASKLNELLGQPAVETPAAPPQRPFPTDPGGVLAVGSSVCVDMHLEDSDGRYAKSWSGIVTDVGSLPAPYIALTDVTFNKGGNGLKAGDSLIFLGPGIIIRPAWSPEGAQTQ